MNNYINVVGKLSNGKWVPLSSAEVNFSCSAGKFVGNDLILDSTLKEDKVLIKAILRENQQISKEIVIFVKKLDTPEKLKTKEEFLNEINAPSRKKKAKKEKNL